MPYNKKNRSRSNKQADGHFHDMIDDLQMSVGEERLRERDLEIQGLRREVAERDKQFKEMKEEFEKFRLRYGEVAGATGGCVTTKSAADAPVSLATMSTPVVAVSSQFGYHHRYTTTSGVTPTIFGVTGGFAASTTTVTVTVSSVPITSTSVSRTPAELYGTGAWGRLPGLGYNQDAMMDAMLNPTVYAKPLVPGAPEPFNSSMIYGQDHYGGVANNLVSGGGVIGGGVTNLGDGGFRPSFGFGGYGAAAIGVTGSGMAGDGFSGFKTNGVGTASFQAQNAGTAGYLATGGQFASHWGTGGPTAGHWATGGSVTAAGQPAGYGLAGGQTAGHWAAGGQVAGFGATGGPVTGQTAGFGAAFSNSGITFRDVEESLNTFGGENGEDVIAWCDEFQRSADTFQWNGVQRVVFAKRLLTGAAKMSLKTGANLETWESLRHFLVAEFKSHLSSVDVHRKMQTRKQEENESLLEYLLAMREIAAKGHLDEEAIIKYTVSGIRGSEANKAMLYGCPSLPIFREKLKCFEEFQHNLERKPIGRHQKSTDEKYPGKCYNCGDNGHAARNCPNKEKGAKCYGCGEFGHISPECPEKLKKKQDPES
jgi:Zinc knuckle